MPRTEPNALALSDQALRVLAQLIAIAGALILALLVASLVARDATFAALGVDLTDATGPIILGMRLIMVAGVASAALVYVVLQRLLAIVRTVRDGDPFVPENALRLRHIAWAVLGLELLHLAIAATASSVSSVTAPLDIPWSFNLTRWLTVLLLFVLARVFEQGARMRDDLEGTV
jgi:hypothetical protein